MKKYLKIFGVIGLGLLTLSLVISLFNGNTDKDDKKPIQETPSEKIKYVLEENPKALNVGYWKFKEDFTYPGMSIDYSFYDSNGAHFDGIKFGVLGLSFVKKYKDTNIIEKLIYYKDSSLGVLNEDGTLNKDYYIVFEPELYDDNVTYFLEQYVPENYDYSNLNFNLIGKYKLVSIDNLKYLPIEHGLCTIIDNFGNENTLFLNVDSQIGLFGRASDSITYISIDIETGKLSGEWVNEDGTLKDDIIIEFKTFSFATDNLIRNCFEKIEE